MERTGQGTPLTFSRTLSPRNLFAVSSLLLLLLTTSGCLSPIALHRAVLAYDDAVTRLGNEQLLLNIIRARYHRPVHFTTVPSVAATFLFQTSVGITPPEGDARGLIGPVVNATVAENPTITIIPMEGEEFQRLLSPMDESKVTALIGFGTDLNMLLRLVGSELRLKEEGRRTVLMNDPERKSEYEQFRRRVLHLASLYQQHQVQIEKLVAQTIWTGQLTGELGPGTSSRRWRKIITGLETLRISPSSSVGRGSS